MKLTLATGAIVDAGCFSMVLDENGWPMLVTCERTFDDLRPVIPAGVFLCKKRMFNRGGYMTFEVTGVEGHSALLFHRGNTELDSLGCILTGMSFGLVNGLPAVLNAQAGFDTFWRKVGQFDEFELEVIGR